MLSNLECPYCASCESTLISNFYSAVLNAKTSVYQCGQCLNLFDYPCDVKRSELQERLSDLQQDTEERTAVLRAANARGRLNNQELAVKIVQIQQESLTAQLSLIRQQMAIVDPANEELLEELKRQEFDIQVKIIEIQKQEVQRRLKELQENVEERISIAAASDISVDPGRGESQTLVVIYGYDCLMNRIPVDSFLHIPSDIRSSNLKYETPTNFDVSTDNSLPRLLRLFFAMFQMILWFWLLCLAFGL